MALGVKVLPYIRSVVEETGNEDLTTAYFAAKVTPVKISACAYGCKSVHDMKRS